MVVGMLFGWVLGVVVSVLFFQLVAAAQADRLSERLFGERRRGLGASEVTESGGGGKGRERGRKVG
jgi:hypothetical protein